MAGRENTPPIEPSGGIAFVQRSVVYHRCRRLRRARDEILERPPCLACLFFVATLAAVFFGMEAWWFYTRQWPGHAARMVSEAPPMEQLRFETPRCYPLDDASDAATDGADLYDYTCMTKSNDGKRCRSGLPFYMFTVAGDRTISWRMCSTFCLQKGFDISGVMDASVCRCGASAANVDVWRAAPVYRPDLAWQADDAVVDSEDPQCRILATRYIGLMPIPRREQDLNDRDLAYVQSILLGHMILQVADSEQPVEPPPKVDIMSLSHMTEERALHDGIPGVIKANVSDSMILNARLDAEKAMDISYRSCYPHQCAAGIPWPIRTVYAAGIPYAFAEDVPESTRVVFRGAIMAYHAATCILFTEVSPSYDAQLKIYVKDDEDGCFTSPVGYPLLYRQDTEINLGWCNTERQIGNMIHELGHAIGMAHEHMRPDRDKFVKIDYAGMSPMMHAQYAKDDAAYVGSREKGYAPYDYASLMHYPSTPQMRTLPLIHGRGVHDAETGQRRGFSVEDVKQLRDMYQCDNRVDSLCVDMDEELGQAISIRGRPATCAQVRKYCKNWKFGKEITYFCPASCNRCPSKPSSLPNLKTRGSMKGCTDVNSFCFRYEEYCPDRTIAGEEQWMAENCRKTCQIARYCDTNALQDVDAEESSPRPPGTDSVVPACIDSTQTGLLNALGQVEGCAGLRDRCRHPTVGSQVRAACPATCGLCHTEVASAGVGSDDPMPKQIILLVSFSLGSDGYDLATSEQEVQLESTLATFARELYREDVFLSLSHSDTCASPCRSGKARIFARCCNSLVEGCDVECGDLRTVLSQYGSSDLTEKFSERGFSGMFVREVSVSNSVDHMLGVLFAADWLTRWMIVFGVAAVVCLAFAIPRSRCFNERRERRRLRRSDDLESDLLESSESEGEDSM